jgi:thiol-disulfide isomerase/thioredoxin
LIGQYPGTYLAKLLTWKNPMYPDDQSRFFEDIDPLDNSAMRSMAISDRIQQFMVKYSKGTDSGFLACIDMVKAHFEPNPITLESALYSMLEGFYNTGKETICQYILDNYIFDEDCGADLSDAIRIRAQGIINLQVGNTPPNFNIATPQGGSIDLMQTCSQNEYTLVMFWASWCHKCEQEMPYIGPMYAKYQYKGFEVIGVSLDQSAKTWTAAIDEKGMTWPQVSQLQAWNSPVVEAYKVTATPTYFLLNTKGEIVLKPERAFEVDNFLKDKM